VLGRAERTSLLLELRDELLILKAEMSDAVATVSEAVARCEDRGDSVSVELIDAATKLHRALQRDLLQLKWVLDRSPLGRSQNEPTITRTHGNEPSALSLPKLPSTPENPIKVDHTPENARASDNHGGGKQSADLFMSTHHSHSNSMHARRESRIKASLHSVIDNPKFSDSLTSVKLEAEQRNLMAQRARDDDLSVELQSARQKLAAIAEQRTKLAQEVVAQNETIIKTLKDSTDAKDDIMSGNEEVKKATTSQNDMRWGIVFFLLLCSASLLFLEWAGR
jgi:hypothetical protein